MEEVTATLNRCDGDAETTINKLLDHCYPHTVILNEPAASCSYLESAPGPSCTSISSESDAKASLEDILQAHSQKKSDQLESMTWKSTVADSGVSLACFIKERCTLQNACIINLA